MDSSNSDSPNQVPPDIEIQPPNSTTSSNQEPDDATERNSAVPSGNEEQPPSGTSPSSSLPPNASSEAEESNTENPSLITVIDNTDGSVISDVHVVINTVIENEKPGSIEEDRSRNDDSDKNDDSARSGDSDRNESADEGLSDNTSNSSSGSQKSRRSNRCQVCRKKIGLTGFTCRCGGLFCSLHRYSDKHNCSFNYRELGAEEIRKNNPVISGEKVNKI